MPAITPKASYHAVLPPLASRFVDVDALPWESHPNYPGIESKVLVVDPSSGMLTMLMRMAPGAVLPEHEHVLVEQTFVIEGSLMCGEGECTAGQFVWRPAGSRHKAWGGPRGGLMVAMFQMPNRFFKTDGTVTDYMGNDWAKTWGAALERHEQAQFETN